MRRILFLALPAILVAGISTAAQATPKKGDSSCSISPNPVVVGQGYVVSASGLPVLSPVNLFVTDANGTTGSPLGSTPDGTFALNESSDVAGTTTYQFTGLVRPNMTIYATCSVQVNS